jgi:hypothetical protein
MMLSKLDINGTALRILTLACYFLPFIFFFSTCVDNVSKGAYNKQEAIANEREKMEAEKKDLLNKATEFLTNNLSLTDSSAQLNSETIAILEKTGDDGWYIQPTFTSLSGVGVLLSYKNTIGPILVVISMALSLLTLILWRALRRGKGALFFLSANLTVVLAFVIMCLAIDVTVLYGAWALVFLLAVQLLSALQDKKMKINATLEGINPN